MSNSNLAYDANPAVAKALPGEFYFSSEILEREKQHVFYDSWVLAGYLHDLRNSGDYISLKIFDQPIVVVRDSDMTLKAFYNACRHRGHMLVDAPKGNTSRLRCRFHAWTYKLDGTLGWAPNSENVPGFCAGAYSLAPVKVDTIAHMVFVNLNPDAKPMSAMYAGLQEEIYKTVPSLDRMHFARRDILDIDANWKFIFDGLECYHCQFIHPGVLNSKEDYMTKDIFSFERDLYQTHVFRGNHQVINGENGFVAPPWAAQGVDSYDLNLWYVWPNIMLMSHPGRANLKVAHAWPIAPDKTVRFIDHFLMTPEPTEIDLAQIKSHRAVFQQDIDAMVSQQAGVRARGYGQGRLMIDSTHSWQSEHATHHFQGLVWNAVMRGR